LKLSISGILNGFVQNFYIDTLHYETETKYEKFLKTLNILTFTKIYSPSHNITFYPRFINKTYVTFHKETMTLMY